MLEITSTLSAVLMTADEIALDFRHVKTEQSATRKQVQAKEDQGGLDIRTDPGSVMVSARILFDHGYRIGIDRSHAIVTAYGFEMNDPNARGAIVEVAKHRSRYNVEIAVCEPGQIRTLIGWKFIIIRLAPG